MKNVKDVSNIKYSRYVKYKNSLHKKEVV